MLYADHVIENYRAVQTFGENVEVTIGSETAARDQRGVIVPGDYPVRLVNINYTPWNPDPEVKTSGYAKNIGPYYALVEVLVDLPERDVPSAILGGVVHSYRHEPAERRKHTMTYYAYHFLKKDEPVWQSSGNPV